MVVDLDRLREKPIPYLGWYLEGEAEPLARYCWYASEDQGQGMFQVCVDGRRVGGEGAAPHDAAKVLGLALVRGKIFLGTWSDGVEYAFDAPLDYEHVPTQRIREAILLGLYRLHETGFPQDTTIDLDGVAAEFAVAPSLVERAVQYLKDEQLIEDYGTFGRNWSTGDFWISTRGIRYLEERGLVASPEVPAADERHAAVMRRSQVATVSDPARVAVVHGRNERLRRELFSFLRALGLRPIEWAAAIRETGSAAPYVGQVIDALFHNIQAVVVLWTGDDSAQLREELRQHAGDAETRLQPRPNVILEAGMALSQMPDRTVLVQIGDVGEISDLAGRHVVRLTGEASRHDLANRLETAGCRIDRSGTDWLKEGNFRQAKARRKRGDTQVGPNAIRRAKGVMQ